MESSGVASTITEAISGYAAELTTVGAAGLGLAIVVWGLPKAFRFFKKVSA